VVLHLANVVFDSAHVGHLARSQTLSACEGKMKKKGRGPMSQVLDGDAHLCGATLKAVS
jgi:hypothetical protein